MQQQQQQQQQAVQKSPTHNYTKLGIVLAYLMSDTGVLLLWGYLRGRGGLPGKLIHIDMIIFTAQNSIEGTWGFSNYTCKSIKGASQNMLDGLETSRRYIMNRIFKTKF